VRRYQTQEFSGLRDRNSKPHHSPRQTSSALSEKLLSLRRLHMPGYQIARKIVLSIATAGAQDGIRALGWVIALDIDERQLDGPALWMMTIFRHNRPISQLLQRPWRQGVYDRLSVE
jgi:hypothetical protein